MHRECFPKGICIHDIFSWAWNILYEPPYELLFPVSSLGCVQEFQYQWNLSHTKLNKTSVTKTQYQKFWYM